jgi:hypothetical protein
MTIEEKGHGWEIQPRTKTEKMLLSHLTDALKAWNDIPQTLSIWVNDLLTTPEQPGFHTDHGYQRVATSAVPLSYAILGPGQDCPRFISSVKSKEKR